MFSLRKKEKYVIRIEWEILWKKLIWPFFCFCPPPPLPQKRSLIFLLWKHLISFISISFFIPEILPFQLFPPAKGNDQAKDFGKFSFVPFLIQISTFEIFEFSRKRVKTSHLGLSRDLYFKITPILLRFQTSI